MRNRGTWAMLVLAAFVAQQAIAGPAEKTKVTVMKFDVSPGLPPTYEKFLYNRLIARVSASDRYAPVDWEEVDRLLQHIAKSQPLLSTEDARRQAISQKGVTKL